MGLDSTGASVSRKINRTYLRNLQTETAQILGMERGKTKGAKHLEPNEFKNLKSKETVAVYVSTADLKKENARLRAELKERGATREDYAKLEAENKRLKELVKSKNLTIEELKKSTKKIEIDLFGKSKIKTIEQEHKAKLKSKDETIKKIKFKVKELEREKESFDEIAPRIYKAMEDYKARAEDLEEKNERLVKENNKLMQENTFLKNAVEALKNAILDKPREIVAQFKNELSGYFKIDVAPKPKEREPEDYQGRHL
jgi:predicted  nucleic acid-binding Zn-ribbon protein